MSSEHEMIWFECLVCDGSGSQWVVDEADGSVGIDICSNCDGDGGSWAPVVADDDDLDDDLDNQEMGS